MNDNLKFEKVLASLWDGLSRLLEKFSVGHGFTAFGNYHVMLPETRRQALLEREA